jgi:hypothetical protein
MLLNLIVEVSFWLGIKHHDRTLLQIFWVHAPSFITPCHIYKNEHYAYASLVVPYFH